MKGTTAWATGWLSLLLAGCYASNVVAVQDRAVTLQTAALTWAPARAADMAGLYESVSIEGDAALSLRRIYYFFDGNGNYSAAALVASESGVAFQALSGTWHLDDQGLVLDQAPPARLLAASGYLRIEAAHGVLVLRRSPMS